jgi:hypothetical protein
MIDTMSRAIVKGFLAVAMKEMVQKHYGQLKMQLKGNTSIRDEREIYIRGGDKYTEERCGNGENNGFTVLEMEELCTGLRYSHVT